MCSSIKAEMFPKKVKGQNSTDFQWQEQNPPKAKTISKGQWTKNAPQELEESLLLTYMDFLMNSPVQPAGNVTKLEVMIIHKKILTYLQPLNLYVQFKQEL